MGLIVKKGTKFNFIAKAVVWVGHLVSALTGRE